MNNSDTLSESDMEYVKILINAAENMLSGLNKIKEGDISSKEFKSLISKPQELLVRKIRLKRCKLCHGPFIALSPRSEYCKRINADTGRHCGQYGPKHNYENRSEMAPYIRTYKRLMARVKIGKMSKDEFNEWNKDARMKMQDVVDNKLSIESYTKWLNKK